MESKNFFFKCKKKKMFGVCSGLSKSFRIDVIYIRLFFSLLTMIGGLGIIIYLMFFLSLDRENKPNRKKVLGVVHYFSIKYNKDLSILRVLSFYLFIITGILPGIIIYLLLSLLILDKRN